MSRRRSCSARVGPASCGFTAQLTALHPTEQWKVRALTERRVSQVLSELHERAEHVRRTGFPQLALAEASHEDADRLDPRARRGFAVPRGVADHHGVAAAGL